MKKYTLTMSSLAAIAVSALALTACSGGGSSDASGKVEGTIGYGFWGNPGRGDKVAAAVDEFFVSAEDARTEVFHDNQH